MTSRHLLPASLLVGTIILSVAVLAPRLVLAQNSVGIVANAPETINRVTDAAKTALKNSADYAITTAVLTAVDTMTQRMAANAATWLISGGNGQSPLAYITGWTNWHNNILLDSVSDSLNMLSTKYAGFGLCAPLNTNVSLRIKLGIARLYAPKPTCSFNNFWNAALQTKTNFTSGQFLAGISNSFEMGQSSLSVALNTPSAVANKASDKYLNEQLQRLTSPFKPVTDIITGNVKTPASMVEASITNATVTGPANADAAKSAAIINHSSLLAAVGANALKMFTSTLAQKAMDKYLKNGVLTGKDIVCATPAGAAFDLCKGVVNEQLAAGDTGSVGTALAAAFFANVIFPPEPVTIDDYSPIGDMSSCPDGTARGIWNCVIDQSFVAALNGKNGGLLSVRDALKKENGSLLHGDWQLVPPSDSRNNDPHCYQSAYCYTNLVKLRRMRIIPVGWEMAANVNGAPITLQGAIDKFNDATSPYYHLVDPDWILKVPVTQCLNQVNGQTLVAPNTSERAKVCVDSPSCISEDSTGKCTGGFGYCTREHSVWQIDATACPPQFSTCNSYTDTKGKQLSVLSNTVDASFCNANNSGCKPYAATGTSSGWSNATTAIYLDSTAASCNASDAGCKELGRISTASTANILPNPGLETTNADGSMAASWTKDWENASGSSQYVRDGMSSFEGIASYLNAGTLSLGGYHNLGGTVDIPIQPNGQYTLSFYARSTGAGNQNGQLEVKLFDRPFNGPADDICDAYPLQGPKPTCVQDLSFAAMAPTCSSTSTSAFAECNTAPGGDWGPTNPNGEMKMIFPLDAGYERYSITFATTAKAHYIGLYFTVPNAPYYLDAFQLEAGSTATAFHVDGKDGTGTAVDIKVPPDYLGCTGEPALDAGKGCGNYANICRQSEVGCDSFTPSDNSAPITAVTSTNDVCNAECVGYNTFKQAATTWEAAQFPLYFIPSTAVSCSRSEVGCDEFTNLAVAANGGEARSYFTRVRACREPDAVNDGTYFTWEGSDTSGFQLKSYTLRNNAGGDGTMFDVPNTPDVYFKQNTTAGSGTTPSDRGPSYLTGTDPAACTAAVYRPGDGSASVNPDCREFIDASGNVFYRLLSATIASTTDCQSYRKTVSTQADCSASGGLWNNGANSCDYYVYAAQSASCRAAASGCRAYTGNQGNNSQAIVNSDFESDNADSWTGGAISNESTIVGGHSYAASTANRRLAGADNTQSILSQGRLYTLTLWAKGSGRLTSRLSMNGDLSTNGNNIFADQLGIKTPVYNLTAEWQRYVLGPIAMDWAPAGSDVLQIGADNGHLYFDNVQLTETQDQFFLVKNSWRTPASCDETPAGQALPQAQLGCSQYENSIGTQVTLKSFDHLCRASTVGCEAFSDNQGTASPFASYKNVICALSRAGASVSGDCVLNGKTLCTVLDKEQTCRFDYDGNPVTQLNSYTAANGITYGFDYLARDVFVVPVDSTRYLVNDGTKSCAAAAVGCTALGDNNLSKLAVCTLGAGNGIRPCSVAGLGTVCSVAPGQTSCSYRIPFAVNGGTVYKIINSSNLSGQLCTEEAVGCQTWTDTKGQSTYFKDPGDAQCEYQEKIKLNNQDVSGWFKKGTQEPCDPTFAVGGIAYGVRKNGDPEFGPNNFAGACKTDYAGCTEFTDHSDTGAVLRNGTNEFPQGRPLYYINDSKIDAAVSVCSGQVSKKQGCMALDQTDNPNKTIDSNATYALSDSQNFELVKPVDSGAVANDANIILKVNRDRVCTEWLECNTEQTVAENGRDSTKCLSVASCTQKGADGRCLTWGSLVSGYPVLSAVNYSARDVTSSGSDYSGFSIPNLPPVAAFRQPSTTVPYALNVNGVSTGQSCKAYPETDAPFPKTVLVNPADSVTTSRQAGYSSANVCDLLSGKSTKYKDCECSYRKAVYGSSLTKYFPTNAETGIKADGTPGEIKSAICSGPPYDGQECVVLATGNRTETNLTCSNGTDQGTCVPFDKIDSVLGQEGYCLEKDASLSINGDPTQTACVTWLPIDAPKGLDTANQYTKAAFIPKVGQERYCAAPAKYCVARDCQNPPGIPAVCTELAATAFSWTPVGGAPNSAVSSCFNACPGGSNIRDLGGQPDCRAKSKVCVDAVNNFCSKINDYDCASITRADQSCSSFDPDPAKPSSDYCKDLYNKCSNYKTQSLSFCANMTTRHCSEAYTQDGVAGQYVYGGDWQCVGDIFVNGQVHYAVNDAYNYFSQVPTYNVDSFCGYKFGTDPMSTWNSSNGLASCATTGKQFCGNDEACSPGTNCVELKDLSVHQTEYTSQEAEETYSTSSIGTSFPSGSPHGLLNYPAIPVLGSHTYFGGATPSGFPALSSPSMTFQPAKGSGSITGDWIDYRETSVDGTGVKVQNPPNAAPATATSTSEVGSYPNDLVGMYSYGVDRGGASGNISLDYDLVTPALLLASQIDRVTVSILSNGGNGLCQYGPNFSPDALGGGAAFGIDSRFSCGRCLNYGDTYDNALCQSNYGYQTKDNKDNENFASDQKASNLVLVSGNNWTANTASSQGSLTISLRISDNEPKRVIGVHIDATDYDRGGYFYLSGLDVHMNGQVCGEAVYIGSSNPTTDTNNPVAMTNSVNNLTPPVDFASASPVGGIVSSVCSPWGAYASTNPLTIVTSSFASKACEMAKGAVYTGIDQIKKLFWKAFSKPVSALIPNGIGVFNDVLFDYSGVVDATSISTQWISTTTPAKILPTINSALCHGDQCSVGAVNIAAINNSETAAVVGKGSVRADLKFYAAANGNQMPIKNITINWGGDGSDAVDSGLNNYYKNHIATQCDASDFARVPDACIQKPFIYSHVYGCPVAYQHPAPAGGYPEIGVKAGDPVCTYAPFVTVTDNWAATQSAAAPPVVVAP